MPIKLLDAGQKPPDVGPPTQTEEALPSSDPGTVDSPARETMQTFPTTGAAVKEPKTFASIHPGPQKSLPKKFVELVRKLEESLEMPVFMIIQHGGDGTFSSMDEDLVDAVTATMNKLPADLPVALLLDSPGGIAKCAFQIGNLFRKNCGKFVAVIPRYAKSAATLLSLGADRIILGKYAELGPLDAQTFDREREEHLSALDEVQALERLHAFALEALDRSMMFVLGRSGKKVGTLYPHMMSFVNGMIRPLFEKIDAVHYTQSARTLKIAEEYAVRLLKPKYLDEEARKIAESLVSKYPDHGFFIGADEADSLGLEYEEPSAEISATLDLMKPFLSKLTVIGTLKKEDGQ